MWHQNPGELICPSDGGLTRKIGTCGYVIYVGSSESPVILGYTAELQLQETASRTRHELLAQLCGEYWIAHLIEKLQEPRDKLSIHLVTDSQAIIS